MGDIDLFEEMENSIFEEYGFEKSGSETYSKGDLCFTKSMYYPNLWLEISGIAGKPYLTFEEVISEIKEKQ
jgi:hypothetical protein